MIVNRELLPARVIVVGFCFLLLVEIVNLMLVIVLVFFLWEIAKHYVGAFWFVVVGGNRESNIGNWRFNVGVVGDLFFIWIGNHESNVDMFWWLNFFG